MLDLLNKIDQVNMILLSHLNLALPKDETDYYIQQLENLLATREELIKGVKEAQTAEEKHLGDKIIKDNKKINQLLVQKTQQLKREINLFNTKKKHNQRYENPYQDTSVDGIFIDKKN
ncbi:hypothetical protein BKP45_07030 [Anaerobacillus alkalidiazotrophicus]|uniref:Flagellar protein FliT n=1 Tax=Anaerobacillus alkalidiazotrophicus TaxID=472963 RepID=A0A1S2MC63_9BACI|nr:hypothetical protein [Anaerobacillus alkalidiazotrophicus]OIJ22382.1 hypothetical protein BKP45_07030 [Anaerobacillus alkalidiazotrophicus]